MPSSRIPHQEAPSQGIRRYRATVRMRLALTYSALLTGSGFVMLGLVYVFMRFVPTYDLAASTVAPAATAVPGTTPDPSAPVVGIPEDGIPAVPSVPSSELLVTSTDQMLNLLLAVSVVVLVILAVIGVAVGWAVAGRMLKPLQYINAAVRGATHGDLGQRIGLTGPRDEISELATNFDTMLEQLERSFAASKRFASNASHELSTPLATSRAMLDVAIARHDDPDVAKVFHRLRIMNERSIEITRALLELARVDSSTARTEPIDLAATAAEVAQACAAEAAGRGITVELSLDAAPMAGDPVLIRQLLTNLVQNAIRHNTDADGHLSIRTASSGAHGEATVVVTNSGPVLDPGTVQSLTEPFFRAAGRTSSSGSKGHGLGLSIVSAIVERHRGALALEAQPTGGLRVTVTFPGASVPSE
ncbi:sensor histidine kinase [Paeniglutamicibacter sp. NPDC012692]|uniref:sensor histidine kinase n=1 Tax=Paeniglutamicibacter sp. NPDC012692 TaxID=3364388 RepID=UPI0036CA0CEE